jgi:hypothetical protein
MSERKLAQCIKMLDFLKKDKIKFTYAAGNQGPLPIKDNELRNYQTYTLHKNGLVDYYGTDSSPFDSNPPRGRPDIEIVSLLPTDAIINFGYSKLKKPCLDAAREHVIERLLEHQLKYNGLEFLTKEE